MSRLFLFSFFLSLAFSVRAEEIPPWVEPRFGPEFTFGVNDDDVDDALRSTLKRMYKHLLVCQPKGAKFVYGKSTCHFISPEGWFFELTRDGLVLEVKMKPLAVDQYKKFGSNIQDAVFTSAANEGYFPQAYMGGGHINIGLQELQNDPLLVRNFIVDFFNHSEISMGIMNYDTNNALPLPLAAPEALHAFERQIEHFDRYYQDNVLAIHTLMRGMHREVASTFDDFRVAWTTRMSRSKHMALSTVHGYDEDPESLLRLEIRSVRPQASMDVFIRQISLFRDRLKFLKTIRHPIPLKLHPKILSRSEWKPSGLHKLQPPISPEEAFRSFYVYVTEAGHKWQDHRDYLWPKWITDGELQKFEESEWFLAHEKSRVLAGDIKKQPSSDGCRNFLF